MKKLLSLTLFLLGLWSLAHATHNRAGEIIYRHLNGLTYEITIVTYTDPNSVQADRCSLTLNFGDSTSQDVPRSNGALGCSGNPNAGVGVQINPRIKVNEYTAVHTFPGNGIYKLSMEDPNRNEGIENVPNSVQVPFYIESYLIISPLSGINNSPTLNFPPVDDGCVNQPFFHSPAAIDEDGDSLFYKIAEPLSAGGQPIAGYTYPHIFSNFGTLTIDEKYGILSWDYPIFQGEYNVAIEIEEYRKSPFTGQPILVGRIRRDMQITIGNCANNIPQFEEEEQICVLGGESIQEEIVAFDQGDLLTLSSVGDAYNVQNQPAIFNAPSSTQDTIKAIFAWNTLCEHIRENAYLNYFKVEDNRGANTLVNFLTLDVSVNGPPPLNPSATPQGNNMILDWDVPNCNNITGYKIYRRVDSSGFVPSDCQTGVPDGLGYSLIEEIDGVANTRYVDDDKGQKLNHGQRYCYLITAIYEGDVEGVASVEVCNELRKDVPIITRVSVNETDSANGQDTIMWSAPTELDDSVQFPGPYFYRLYRSVKEENNFSEIYQSPTNANLFALDTIFEDSLLNTAGLAYEYSVELYSDTTLVGSTKEASSVFLSIEPSDRALILSWDYNVPWTNKVYEIYKFNTASETFSFLDSTRNRTYRDRNLVNGESYSYFVRAFGEYSTDNILNPLLNNSQIASGIPVDTIPPCPPLNPQINASCDLDQIRLNWEIPEGDSCFSDAVRYNLYFTPVLGQEYELVETINDPLQQSIQFDNLESIAGCYALTLVDSFDNESDFSARICADNCPLYRLPNVFTPGGDGFNDFFTPFPYKYVESIDLKLYNRWGNLIFETNDPDIRWDGTNAQGEQVADGVYFYICEVNEIRLSGIETRTLKGNLTVINGKQGTNNQ